MRRCTGPPARCTGLTANPATGNDADGEPAGRTQVVLTWMMPAVGTGEPATSYRIDYSDTPTRTRVWRNFGDECSGNGTRYVLRRQRGGWHAVLHRHDPEARANPHLPGVRGERSLGTSPVSPLLPPMPPPRPWTTRTPRRPWD